MPATLSGLALGVALTALFGWLGARPPDLRRGPRLLPWRFLMLLGAAWTLLMLIHLANLAGMRTGRRPDPEVPVSLAPLLGANQREEA